MLNYCKIQLANNVKSIAKSQNISTDEAIKMIAQGSGKSGSPDAVIMADLKEILSEETRILHPVNGATLVDFFKDADGNINHKLYEQVYQTVRIRLATELFINNIVNDNNDLNFKLRAYRKRLESGHHYDQNPAQNVYDYYTIKKKISEGTSSTLFVSKVSDYLIINHLPILIQAWFNDVISYRPSYGYSFKIMHKLGEDWITKDQDDREPELNAILKLMLECVPISRLQYSQFGWTQSPDKLPFEHTVVAKAFYDSIQNEFQNMSDEDFKLFIENPYSIINYLITKYNKEKIKNKNNLMHNIVRVWFGNGNSTFFRKAFSKSNTIRHIPVDIIVAAFVKYRPKRYVEHINGESATIIEPGFSNTTEIGRIYDFIDNLDIDRDPVFSSLIKKVNGEYVVLANENFIKDPLAKYASQLIFGSTYDFSRRTETFKKILEYIATIKTNGSTAETFFKTKQKGGNPNHTLLGELTDALSYVPTAVYGTKETKEGKNVAVFGVSSVANSVEDVVYQSRKRVKRIQDEYKEIKALEGDSSLVIVTPVSPMEHTKLYNHKKLDSEAIFAGTIYNATLTAEIDGEEVTKHVNNCSTPEAFQLAIVENFIKGWTSKNVIRNQAITPSDKVAIPNFEWNVDKLQKDSVYGSTNSKIERNVMTELQNIYGQLLFNSVSDIAQVLQMFRLIDKIENESDDEKSLRIRNTLDALSKNEDLVKELNTAEGNVTKLNRSIIEIANELNSILQILQVTDNINDVNGLPQLLQRFRSVTKKTVNGGVLEITKNISKIHDYQTVTINNGDSEFKCVQISKYLTMVNNNFTDAKYLNRMYLHFLSNLSRELPIIKVSDKQTINVRELLADPVAAEKSILYTYFLMNLVLSENVLINTVGMPGSHKHSLLSENEVAQQKFQKDYDQLTSKEQKEVNDYIWDVADSSAHLTMVKRMVALTATMHAGIDNVLSGCPNELKTLIIPNEHLNMFAYSGNTTGGNGFESDLELWDGGMIGTGITSSLFKQSAADTKPDGMAQKLICHSQDAMKTSPNLYKCANFVIDNANLRLSSHQYTPAGYLSRSGYHFMKMQLDQAQVRMISLGTKSGGDPNKGYLKDYNNDLIMCFGFYTNPHSNAVYAISDFYYDRSKRKFIRESYNINDANRTIEVAEFDNNLYEIWLAFGGAWSCDKDGFYNENSQDFIVNLINQLGTKKDDVEVVRYQSDVKQYLKQEIVYYFCTESANKSIKSSSINYDDAINNPNARIYNKVYLNNFGFQLDPNHSSEDSNIREISQLMSFLAEDMMLPESTRLVYKTLKGLMDSLNTKTFINLDSIQDYNSRKAARKQLDDIFGTAIKRIFADPNTDTMGLINEITRGIIKLQNKHKVTVPYSDHQMLGKTHTTIGSQLNKYIARSWTGRADVLVPSHNLFMIYEDEVPEGELYGITYLADDKHYNLETNETESVGEYLHNKVWMKGAEGVMNEEYWAKHKISAYEVMPTDVYWENVGDDDNPTWQPRKIETYDDIVEVSQAILNHTGAKAKFVRAIDLPRNLRSKHVFVDVILDNGQVERIGLYHLNSYKKLAALGRWLGKHKSGDIYEIDNIKLTYEQALEEKKNMQNKIESELLPAIAHKRIKNLQSELPLSITNNIVDFRYVCKDEERLTTNNYTNVFGGIKMNFAEISQKKDLYFYEKLVERFSDISMNDNVFNYDVVFYNMKGQPTRILLDINPDNPLTLDMTYESTYPVVDEDGWRLNEDNEKMYEWPENAQLYIHKNGTVSSEVIVLKNIEDLKLFVENDAFVFYRTKPNLNLEINWTDLYRLNDSDNMQDTFKRLAKKQYESWVKSNDAIMARIPSQSLSFAMAIRTVGYLPYGNNITMVPNSNVFLEGSDFKYIGIVKSR